MIVVGPTTLIEDLDSSKNCDSVTSALNETTLIRDSLYLSIYLFTMGLKPGFWGFKGETDIDINQQISTYTGFRRLKCYKMKKEEWSRSIQRVSDCAHINDRNTRKKKKNPKKTSINTIIIICIFICYVTQG